MAVSKTLRFNVLRRDNFKCRYCGAQADRVDHVTPRAMGGPDTAENLVAACEPCNSGKAAIPPDAPMIAQVSEANLRWADAIKRVGAQRAASQSAEKTLVDNVSRYWMEAAAREGWNYWAKWPDGARDSIANFYRSGLNLSDLKHAVDVVMGKSSRQMSVSRMWKYFCGVCWTEIRDRQAKAMVMLEAEEAAHGGDR